MPNGKYNPQCFNCQNIIYVGEEGHCGIHTFLMPRIPKEMICKDWNLSKEDLADKHHYSYANSYLKSDCFNALKPGTLYYYSYVSANEEYESLGSFESLRFPILCVSIHEDPEFEWVIQVDTYYEKYFPPIQGKLFIQLDKDEYECEILGAERTKAKASHRNSKDEWETTFGLKDLLLIRCIKSPKAFSSWFRHYFDMDAIHKKYLSIDKSGGLNDLGVFVFIERLSENRYRLRPDFYQHREFIKTRLAS